MIFPIFDPPYCRSNQSNGWAVLTRNIPFLFAASSRHRHSIQISVDVSFLLLLRSLNLRALKGSLRFVLADVSGMLDMSLDPLVVSAGVLWFILTCATGIGDIRSLSFSIAACAPLNGVEESILLFFLEIILSSSLLSAVVLCQLLFLSGFVYLEKLRLLVEILAGLSCTVCILDMILAKFCMFSWILFFSLPSSFIDFSLSHSDSDDCNLHKWLAPNSVFKFKDPASTILRASMICLPIGSVNLFKTLNVKLGGCVRVPWSVIQCLRIKLLKDQLFNLFQC